ncbi:alpha/beta fold hydrolase [Pseudonocardia sp. CA-107938]|uniref:alpha/beta fold hydrolase n=1 Tax=Pseudonocardia sp. CA-107938 TaxID=3240021 RepID=UPI003D8BDEE6
MEHQVTPSGIAYTTGGAGPGLLLLVHGMGANGAVWRPMLETITWPGRWVAPDLRGHGRSLAQPPFSYGVHAADLATVVAEFPADEVVVVGHSFGGVLGAVLAGDLFQVPVRSVLAVGVKLEWSEEDVAGARRVAGRPPKVFDTEAEAADFALRLAGLGGLASADDPVAATTATDGGFRAALDPRALSVVGPDVRALLRSSRAPLHLAAGADDPMVTADAMRSVDPEARVIGSAGHNVHWERPDEVWRLVPSG